MMGCGFTFHPHSHQRRRSFSLILKSVLDTSDTFKTHSRRFARRRATGQSITRQRLVRAARCRSFRGGDLTADDGREPSPSARQPNALPTLREVPCDGPGHHAPAFGVRGACSRFEVASSSPQTVVASKAQAPASRTHSRRFARCLARENMPVPAIVNIRIIGPSNHWPHPIRN